MSGNLKILAGPQAYSLIKDEGLKQKRIKVIAGAAGGPKWLVLNGLDRLVFSSFFKKRKEPLFLIGSSIGAWRFAAAAQKKPLEAIKHFEENYIAQQYHSAPTAREVTEKSLQILNEYLTDSGVEEILNHPFFRLNVLAARCRWPASEETRILQGLGLASAYIANRLNRDWLKIMFERTLFYDIRKKAPFFGMDQFPIQHVPLSSSNLKTAIMASGSIPLVMSGIHDINGAEPGMYRDGGMIDYHPDLPFLEDPEGIVFFPHYTDRIIPGWFDKKLPDRIPSPGHMKNVLLIAPSQTFINKLPMEKIPDRNDFIEFKGRDNERFDYWKYVVTASKWLGEEFMEAVESGSIKKKVQKL